MVQKNKNQKHVEKKRSNVNLSKDPKKESLVGLEEADSIPEIEEIFSTSEEEESASDEDEDEDEDDDNSEEVEDSGDEYDEVDEEESVPEDQGGSSSDEDELERQMKQEEESDDDDDDDRHKGDKEEGGSNYDYDLNPRTWGKNIAPTKRNRIGSAAIQDRQEGQGKTDILHSKGAAAMHLHTDDFSSDDDDEDGTGNRIGRIPLHWYEEYDHIGYDLHGSKVMKRDKKEVGDLIDQALKNDDDKNNNLSALATTVYDALNDKEVELSARQIELLRRIQAGAFAHPEFDANPEYVDYFSGVDTCISGIGSNRYEPKHRFQPSKWEKLMVRRLLHRLKNGKITMDYLTGKDNKNLKGSNKEQQQGPYFLLWKGDEEDEIALRRGPMHLAAPKVAPPGHAESYNPSEEYLPTEEELKQWEQMDVKDRPFGLLIPQKFTSLRSVGAYDHSVRESFERCLDLYLCPRVMKRRLNIDPETLVPSLPKPSDLRPFPTALCVRYDTPYIKDKEEPPMIRCLSVSPDGQYLTSGASDGFVRLWEVQTGRLLRSWDVSSITEEYNSQQKQEEEEEERKESDALNNNNSSITETTDSTATSRRRILPVIAVEWNPNKSHHCLLAVVGCCAVIIATGTGGAEDAELTDALLTEAAAAKGDNVKNSKAAQAVKWFSVVKAKSKKNSSRNDDGGATCAISAFGGSFFGPVCVLTVNKEISNLKWHRRGDYFLTVAPKAGAASVLVHQLSKANSQQPFSKSKGGDTQCACFHPNKPFLFIATQQQVRVYHLIKQEMVKRLISGCRWISSLDVHPSGDHLLVGSLDRRVAWFDLDLSSTPYKTLKYHEKAVRSVSYHYRYPLFATSSDDGTVHVFHGMVYSDLMRNPLLVPVKVLRGHTVTKKFGVLASIFHPTQPWLFSAGADGKIILFQDI